MARVTLTPEQTLELLQEVPDRIAQITDGLSEDEARTVTGRDRWAATDALAHLRVCADVWGDCIARILAEDRPTIRAVNPHTAIKGTAYHRQAFRDSFAAYRRQRRQLVRVLKRLGEDEWLRSASVVGAGAPLERSALYYAAWLARHERTHLSQFTQLVRAVRA